MIDIDKKKVLGRGATATIYQAKKGGKDYAAKIFHQGKKINVKKIEAMMANPPKNKFMKIDGLSFLQFAWPTELIYSDKKEITGFLMPLIDLKNSFSLDVFYDKVLFHKLNSANEVALTFKLAIAKNLASAVADLHKDKHYFIDLKPQNIRVAKGTHAVSLLDCDGFSITGKDGSRFPAELISTDYIAPEVTNKNESPKNLGEAQDLYALAVILFQLLNHGTHPFQGIIRNNLKANTNDEKAARGYYPHGLKPHSYIDPRQQSVHSTFLDSTRKLFDEAFVGNASSRPKASVWVKHFDEILKKKLIVRCSKHSNDLSHLRFKDMECPSCYLEKINGSIKTKKIQPTSRKVKQKNTSYASPPSPVASGLSMQPLWWIIGIIAAIIFINYISESKKKTYSNYSNKSYSENSSQPQKSSSNKNCAEVMGECQGYIKYNNAEYKGFAKKGEMSGWGVLSFFGGDLKDCIHSGNFKNDKANGYGTLECKNGYYEAGDYKDDQLIGKVTIRYKNGDTFNGEFKNNEINGKGKYIFKSTGNSYEGEFKNGLRHGYGIFTSGKDKSVLKGYWENDNFIPPEEPKKTETVKNENETTKINVEKKPNKTSSNQINNSQEKIKQEHREFQIKKEAEKKRMADYERRWPNLSESEKIEIVRNECKLSKTMGFIWIVDKGYSCNAYANNEDLTIAYSESSGGGYESDTSGGADLGGYNSTNKQSENVVYGKSCLTVIENCYGSEVYSDGSKYTGYWKNKKYDGQGTLTIPSGDYLNGNFKAGVASGPGVYHFKSGDRAEGNLVNGWLEGKGTYFFRNGDSMEAYFVRGETRKEGKTTYYFYADPRYRGDRWEGPIKNGLLNGKGIYIRANGERIEANYVNGQPQGGFLDFLMTPPDKVPSTQGSFGN
jgi:hypothetical protein